MEEAKGFREAGDVIVQLPAGVIQKCMKSADEPVSVLADLAGPWCLVLSSVSGDFFTMSLQSYDEAAEAVASLYGTKDTVHYVLHNGVPRKKVRVNVRARL